MVYNGAVVNQMNNHYSCYCTSIALIFCFVGVWYCMGSFIMSWGLCFNDPLTIGSSTFYSCIIYLSWFNVQHRVELIEVTFPIKLSDKYLRENKPTASLCAIFLFHYVMKPGLHTNNFVYALLIPFPCCIYFNSKAQTKVSFSERPLLAIQFFSHTQTLH